MFCIWCGAQVEDNSQFCPECGGNLHPGGVPNAPKCSTVQPTTPAPTPAPLTQTVWEPVPRQKSSATPLIIALTIVICILAVAVVLLILLLRTHKSEVATLQTSPPLVSNSGVQSGVRPDVPAPPAVSPMPTPTPTPTPSPEPSPEPEDNSPAYVISDSDSRYLTEADLTGLTDEELRIARNEIYARHGRTFSDQTLQDYFDQQPWYQGSIAPEDFSQSLLNEYERQNASLILDYENGR